LVNPLSSQAIPDIVSSYGQTFLNVFSYDAPTYLQDNIFFTSQTNPRSQSWAGDSTGVDVCFIQHDGNNMKFVVNPQIEGPCNMTDSAWFYVRNVPEGANIEWSTTNALTLLTPLIISGANNMDSVKVVKRDLPQINNVIPPHVPAPCSQIKVTIRSGETSYSIQRCIYDVEHPLPIVSVTGAPLLEPLNPWYALVSYSFTITNCLFVPDSLLSWRVTELYYDRHGRPSLKKTSYTGHSISYTPITYYNTTGHVDIIVTDEALECPENKVSLSYTTIGPPFPIGANDADTPLFQLKPHTNDLQKVELWHSMYGLMRTQEMQNTNESIETTGLPQGVYIILYKDQNGTIIDQKKIMINN